MSMTNGFFAKLPKPPYYAVIFSSLRSRDEDDYGRMADRMVELASVQPGYLGVESVRAADGFGITVSYWTNREAVAAWRAHAEHQIAQETGKKRWYEHYEVRIAYVERAYSTLR